MITPPGTILSSVRLVFLRSFWQVLSEAFFCYLIRQPDRATEDSIYSFPYLYLVRPAILDIFIRNVLFDIINSTALAMLNFQCRVSSVFSSLISWVTLYVARVRLPALMKRFLPTTRRGPCECFAKNDAFLKDPAELCFVAKP